MSISIKIIMTMTLVVLAGCAANVRPVDVNSVDVNSVDAEPILASESESLKAKQFTALANVSNVYVTKAERDFGNLNLDLTVDGQNVGIFKDGQFLNFQLAPGRHEFKTTSWYEGRELFLNSNFDLNVSSNSVVYLQCYGNLTRGLFARAPEGPILQKWDTYCPDGDVTDFGSVKGCLKPNIETTAKELRGRTNSYCELVSDTAAFIQSDLVLAKVALITTEEHEFKMSQAENSIEAYNSFLRSYPQGTYTAAARKALLLLQKRLAADKIAEVLERDASLPLQLKKDKYMLSLTSHLKNQQFQESLFYFELLEHLNVAMPPSFDFFWGEALLRTGSPEPARDKLYVYLTKAGSDGRYYTRALELTSEAEDRLRL